MISKLLYFSLFILASINKCENQKHSIISDNDTNNIKNQVVIIDSSKNNVTENWKTYSNPKLPFTFQYPTTWIINGREYYPISPKGEIMSVMFTLIDTITSSSFFLEYHMPPYGKQLFESSLSDYNKSTGMFAKHKNEIQIAGSNAIVATDSFYIERSSEKEIVNLPLYFILINFL